MLWKFQQMPAGSAFLLRIKNGCDIGMKLRHYARRSNRENHDVSWTFRVSATWKITSQFSLLVHLESRKQDGALFLIEGNKSIANWKTPIRSEWHLLYSVCQKCIMKWFELWKETCCYFSWATSKKFPWKQLPRMQADLKSKII